MREQGILFDFGGTIDTNGIHWFEKFREAYENIDLNLGRDDLFDVYVQTERAIEQGVIKPDMNFRDILEIKFKYHNRLLKEKELIENDIPVNALADKIYDELKENIDANKEIFVELKEKYKLGVVSNFYGNLDAVLKDFEIFDFFDLTIDSTIFGIRKPDSGLYAAAIDKIGLAPEEITIVGDSYKNDIEPGKKLNCTTIWLKVKGLSIDSGDLAYDFIINKFKLIIDILR